MSKKKCLVREITEKQTKTGSSFLVLNLSDKENSFSAKIWNESVKTFAAEKGDVIEIRYEIKTYNGTEDVIIDGYKKTDENSLDYVPRIEENPEELYKQILDVAGELRPSLREIVVKIYEDYKEVLLSHPAAKSVHHDLIGGLLLHTYRMLQAAIGLEDVYPDIDMDMVYAGVILHDIGKVKELRLDECGNVEYTSQGTLFGHMPLGFVLVHEYGVRLDTNEEDLNILLHIILAHQGLPEYGSCMIPCTAEAYIVHSLDMIDSRVYQYEKWNKSLDAGEHTPMAIKTLGGARVYHRK